jgi:hypothetical protein
MYTVCLLFVNKKASANCGGSRNQERQALPPAPLATAGKQGIKVQDFLADETPMSSMLLGDVLRSTKYLTRRKQGRHRRFSYTEIL